MTETRSTLKNLEARLALLERKVGFHAESEEVSAKDVSVRLRELEAKLYNLDNDYHDSNDYLNDGKDWKAGSFEEFNDFAKRSKAL